MSGAQFRQLKVIINIYRFLPFLSVFCWNIFTSREVGEADSKDGESIYWNDSLGGIAAIKNCWPVSGQQAAVCLEGTRGFIGQHRDNSLSMTPLLVEE